ATTALEHDEQIIDRAVFESVRQDDVFAEKLVSLRVPDDDMSLSPDFARLACPGHSVRRDVIAVALHPDLSEGRDYVIIAIVSDLVGTELNELICFGWRGCWSRCRDRRGSRLGLGGCLSRKERQGQRCTAKQSQTQTPSLPLDPHDSSM